MTFSIEERAMKEKIENYSINAKELERLRQKYERLYSDTGKLTASYGFNYGGGSSFSSKVENVIINKMYVQERMEILEKEVETVDTSQKNALNDFEKEVIDYVKNGFKMSYIARIKKIDRKDIKKARDKAIKKMVLYIEHNT